MKLCIFNICYTSVKPNLDFLSFTHWFSYFKKQDIFISTNPHEIIAQKETTNCNFTTENSVQNLLQIVKFI